MHKKVQQGFTLIELIITVAIIAILAGIAYPNYTSHLAKGKRNSAQSFMQQLASREEQQLLNTRCYFSYPTDAACAPPSNITVPEEVTANYTVTVAATNAAGSPPTYTITATPIAGGTQASRDAKCGTLTLTNTGAKGASGSSGGAACWK